ncbi:MAG TPA: MFS transporter [Methylomirabilota bacterium]|nr:MFS transporter [Methylomirabilota bacterium]
MPGRRAVIAWCLYDWANSAFPAIVQTFVFATYFTSAVAATPAIGTALWGQANSIAALAIAILGPVFGAIADQGGARKPWLLALTLLSVVATAALWFVRPNPADALFGLVAMGIATIGFELGTTFYNAMLPDLVPAERVGRVSGWGWGVGYAGGLVCLVLALLLFVQPDPPPFGLDRHLAEHVRITAPLTAVWFAVFSLPLLLWVPDRPAVAMGTAAAIRSGVGDLFRTLAQVRRHANIARFLLAKMIYIDGLNTLFTFGGIYAAGTFGMSLKEVLLFGILLNITAGIGAIGFAWVDDWIGAKPTILISLVAMTLLGGAILLVDDKAWFYGLALAIGIFLGPAQAASRSFMARVAPPERRAEFFGLYSFAGKATAFVGPALVGWATYAFDSQRAGMATIVPFFIIGVLLLLPVKEARS